MKAEKVIISFIAVVVGILAAGVAFYLYQSTKTVDVPKTPQSPITKSPAPTSENSFFLTIDSPKDEDVIERKTITISGKTTEDATVIVSSQLNDIVITPSRTGAFTTTTAIEDGASKIEILAIAPNGEEKKEIRTITFSTENF